jgi:putative glutamine amidotransferase
MIEYNAWIMEMSKRADSLKEKKMMNSNLTPWIGMPTQLDPGGDKQYLSREYPDAVSAAGGIPIMIPLLQRAESVRTLAQRLDGILLPGSNSDVDPSFYNAERMEVCGPAQPLRDQMDFLLLDVAFERRIPLLAICYGVQSLNVFLKGTLIQDIPALIGTSICHRNPKSKNSPRHEIEISPGSILERFAGGPKATVNSIHHQALDRPGRGLEVIARAPDGIIESASYADPSRWILGVQWHPEKSFACDGFSQKLFNNFVAQCRAVGD